MRPAPFAPPPTDGTDGAVRPARRALWAAPAQEALTRPALLAFPRAGGPGETVRLTRRALWPHAGGADEAVRSAWSAVRVVAGREGLAS